MTANENSDRECPFCRLEPAQVVLANAHALAVRDLYPISLGHSLIIPRHHVTSVFHLSPEELAGIWVMVREVRAHLQAEHRPNAFTIGVNDGTAAGQTICHGHVHVVPRYQGDVPDPRGGIRWVIPEKAPYWKELG
jgi:diadenosine tetraphosphate (Ap4A) HIT family hydrolase